MTASIRAADALARRLYKAGCRVAFGMPGGEVLTLVDALETAGIQFVLAKHKIPQLSWPKAHGTALARREF